MNFIKRLSVIGAGQMGGGIAMTIAKNSKLPVILYDTNVSQLEKQEKLINRLFEKEIAKDKLQIEEKKEVIKRIVFSNQIDELQGVDFIIEAINEDYTSKVNVIRAINDLFKSDTTSPIFATNTSSIPITKLASNFIDPTRFIGMHFMNPVPVMKLVELISGKQTSKGTLESTRNLAESMGKITSISQDIPGFIANRILMPYINEAIYTLYEGIGDRDDIDKTMVLGTNVPMGPLKLADFVGLDTCLAIIQVLHTELGDSKYRPCPLLVQMVNAGWLGKKSGKGFYSYTK